jgi:hypothetical protein
VVNQLAAFHPTHVAVERLASDQAALDERYTQYRAGKYALGRSEQEQIGMRLAAKLGLPRVDAVDWNGNPPGPEASYDWDAWGKAHDFSNQLAVIADPARIPFHALGTQSVNAWLLDFNRPEALAASHRQYFEIARIGKGDDQPGAAWVGTWYARNLRIFNNLMNIASKPDDRVVVIYGAGHAYLLRQLARESGAFQLVDVDQVLKPGPAR